MNALDPPEAPLERLDVLLVEDEAAVSLLIEDMLQTLGAASIRLAGNVRSALDLLQGYRPGLAVLDVNLAGEMVYPVAAKLEHDRVPFLFITGYGRDGIDRRFSTRPVLQKPFRLATFETALRAALSTDGV